MSGTKHDAGKPRPELLPPDALIAVAEVLTFGAEKYGARNWERGLAFGRLYGAQLRHLLAWWRGEDADAETGFSHLAHAACCSLMLLALAGRRPDLDDRPGRLEAESPGESFAFGSGETAWPEQPSSESVCKLWPSGRMRRLDEAEKTALNESLATLPVAARLVPRRTERPDG